MPIKGISGAVEYVSRHQNKIILSVAIVSALLALTGVGIALGSMTAIHYLNPHAFSQLQSQFQSLAGFTPFASRVASDTSAALSTIVKAGWITAGVAGGAALLLGGGWAIRKYRAAKQEGSAIKALRDWLGAHKTETIGMMVMAIGAVVACVGIGFITSGSIGFHVSHFTHELLGHLPKFTSEYDVGGVLKAAFVANSQFTYASYFMLAGGLASTVVGLAAAGGTGLALLLNRMRKVDEARQTLLAQKRMTSSADTI